jgi:hypothetical protein
MKRETPASRSRVLFLLTCVPLWGGCAAMGTLDTADTVPKGKTRLCVQGWVQGVDDNLKPGVLPQVAAAARVGVADGVDIGGKLSLLGVEGSLKVQLAGREEGAPFVMSVAPTVGALTFSHAWMDTDWKSKTQLYAALPILLAGRGPDGSQLVLGLRPTWMRFEEVANPEIRNVLGMGLSLGYAFRVNEGLRVMPEFSVMVPLMERVNGSGISWTQMNGKPHLQAGMAFLMDPAK